LSDVPIGLLLALLGVLLLLSAFFSGSETGLMTLNRYRLRHLAKSGHLGARLAEQLLERPDRLIGLILIGNNFVNILASAIATVIALRLWGEAGIAIATGLLTLLVLIFSEVAPKTFAARHPEAIAFPAAFVYTALKRPALPLVALVNFLANGVLRLLGARPPEGGRDALSREELRTVLMEAGSLGLNTQHRDMLLKLMDLETMTVEDVMIPRHEVYGIDLEEDWEVIQRRLFDSPYSRLPVYEDSLDHTLGYIRLRSLIHPLREGRLTPELLRQSLREPYFIPEGTPLYRQLINFQRERRRMGLVVDEYGDILGLVTLEDILEEVVGKFTTDVKQEPVLQRESEGVVVADGSLPLRTLNQELGISLPLDGPRTLNGLVLEVLQTLPDGPAAFVYESHLFEVLECERRTVRTVRVHVRVGEAPAHGG